MYSHCYSILESEFAATLQRLGTLYSTIESTSYNLCLLPRASAPPSTAIYYCCYCYLLLLLLQSNTYAILGPLFITSENPFITSENPCLLPRPSAPRQTPREDSSCIRSASHPSSCGCPLPARCCVNPPTH